MESQVADRQGNLLEKAIESEWNLEPPCTYTPVAPDRIKPYRECILQELALSVVQYLLRKQKGEYVSSSSKYESDVCRSVKSLMALMDKLPENYFLSIDPEDAILHLSILERVRKKRQSVIRVHKGVSKPSGLRYENACTLYDDQLKLIMVSEKECTHLIVMALMNIGAQIIQMQNTKTSDELYLYSLKISIPNEEEKIAELEIEEYVLNFTNNGLAPHRARGDDLPVSNEESVYTLRNLFRMGSGGLLSNQPTRSTSLKTSSLMKARAQSCWSYFDVGDYTSHNNYESFFTDVPVFCGGCWRPSTIPPRACTSPSIIEGRKPLSLVVNTDDNAMSTAVCTRNCKYIETDGVSTPGTDRIRFDPSKELELDIEDIDQPLPPLTCESNEMGHEKVSYNNVCDTASSVLEGHEFDVAAGDVQTFEVLAKGFASTMFLASHKGKAVVLKAVRFPVVSTDKDSPEAPIQELKIALRNFRREVKALKRLNHPNVCPYFGSCFFRSQPCLVLKYVSGGSLCDFIRIGGKGHSLPLCRLLPLMEEVAEGLRFIHSNGFMHRDIKSANILVDENTFQCMITDLGFCCSIGDDVSGETGTYRWMAPEVIKHEKYDTSVDVYSYGIVLWEFVVKKVPFEGLTPVQAAYAVACHGTRPHLPQNTPQSLCKLIKKCWADAPISRPTFKDVCCVLLPTVMEDFKLRAPLG